MRTFRQFITEYVSGEYTFGFELEALIGGLDRITTIRIAESWTGRTWSDHRGLEVIRGIIERKLGLRGTIGEDPSVKAAAGVPEWAIGEYQDAVFPFEFKSGTALMTPSNLSRVISALENLGGVGIFTNKSCGMHFHMSWPNMTATEAFWVVTQLALDPTTKGRFITPTINGKAVRFESRDHASATFLNDIKSALGRVLARAAHDRSGT